MDEFTSEGLNIHGIRLVQRSIAHVNIMISNLVDKLRKQKKENIHINPDTTVYCYQFSITANQTKPLWLISKSEIPQIDRALLCISLYKTHRVFPVLYIVQSGENV